MSRDVDHENAPVLGQRGHHDAGSEASHSISDRSPNVVAEWSTSRTRPGHWSARRSSPAQLGTTAVVSYNSLIALGVMYRLAVCGVAVPDEMSVVSCDDLDTLGAAELSLTALHLPVEDAAREAVRLLLVGGSETTSRHVTLPATLLLRESSSRARPAQLLPD